MPLKQDFIQRGPILPPKQSLDMRAVGMALFAHALLILALVLNLDWKTENQGPMQIELWADGTTPTAAPAQSTKPEVKPEPTPPKPEPEPEPVKPPPPPPPPPEPPPPPTPPAVVETPKNEIDPEIALENERKKKAEKERIEQELAEKKAKEDERREKDRIKREKDAAEKKEREKLEQIERVEKEKKERERVEQAERLEKEKKDKEEKEKKAVADKKEKEKKEKEEKEKKLAEEKKASEAKAAAAKKAAADQAFKDAMRGDVMGAAGMPGGTADRNQAGGGNYSGYGAKVRACVQPGVSFPAPPQSGSNPTAQYRVQLKSDGTVSGVKLLKTSGNSNFDQAVERGISRCTPFPKPDSGSYPSYIDVDYRMY